MDEIKSNKLKIREALKNSACLLIGFIAVYFYWQMSFYYYLLDEMTMLSEFFDIGWASIFRAQNEHFAPFFKVLLYSYPKIFGNAVLPWRNLSLFTHFLAVVAAYYLIREILKDRQVAALCAVFFSLCPLMWETMYMQSGLGTTSSVFSWFVTLFLFLKADETKNRRLLYLGYLALFLQSYTFGNNLFYPLVIIALYVFKPSEFRWRNIGYAIFIQIINIVIFLKLGSFQNNRNFLGGTSTFTFDLLERMAAYFAVSFYANFGRALIAIEPDISKSLFNLSVFIPFIFALLSSLYVMFRSKEFRPLILTGWVNYGLVIGLISVSRYRLPFEQSLSSRYIYLVMPAIILILAPTLVYFAKRVEKLPLILICLVLIRYMFTFSYLQNERHKAETLHARNYQLIVYAKDHPGVRITDFLATAYLPTARVVGMLEKYEIEKRIELNHRIPERLKSPDKEIKIRLN